jgi:hypothetical protein
MEPTHSGRLCAPGHEIAVDQTAQLDDTDALRGDRHDDTCQARLRLAQLERVHRLDVAGELVGEPVQAEAAARRGRVRAELRPERGVDEQPFD